MTDAAIHQTPPSPNKIWGARRRAKETRALLVEAFPSCFRAKGQEKPPLAIGIRDQILALRPEIGARRLTDALVDYTSGPTYLRNVVEGAARYGLAGDVAGFVTKSDADHAACRMRAFGPMAAAS